MKRFIANTLKYQILSTKLKKMTSDDVIGNHPRSMPHPASIILTYKLRNAFRWLCPHKWNTNASTHSTDG